MNTCEPGTIWCHQNSFYVVLGTVSEGVVTCAPFTSMDPAVCSMPPTTHLPVRALGDPANEPGKLQLSRPISTLPLWLETGATRTLYTSELSPASNKGGDPPKFTTADWTLVMHPNSDPELVRRTKRFERYIRQKAVPLSLEQKMARYFATAMEMEKGEK